MAPIVSAAQAGKVKKMSALRAVALALGPRGLGLLPGAGVALGRMRARRLRDALLDRRPAARVADDQPAHAEQQQGARAVERDLPRGAEAAVVARGLVVRRLLDR